MNKYSALLLAIMTAVTANAEQITESQAAAIARKYMPETSGKKMARAKSTDASNGATAPYYVFNFGNNEGFVVVSGDDSLTELIGYSDKGTFSTENMPQNLRSYFATYSEYVEKVQSGEAKPIRRASEVGTPVVDVLLKTEWNQDEPFNRLCPAWYQNENEILPTGCVATALAQVMNYYEYPATGKGSNGYAYVQDYTNFMESYFEVYTDFSQSTYDWDNMLDKYERYYDTNNNIVNEYTDEQAEAVALLMKDCGAAVLMSYAPDGSGALDYDIPYGVATYFGYNSEIFKRGAMTDTQFLDKIKKELDNEKPLVFCGTGNLGGHCFVADGYDSNDLLHINWGWGGLSDGWFDINVMDPYELGIGGGGGGFVYSQSVTTMEPDSDGDGFYGNSPLIYSSNNSYQTFVRADKESLVKGDNLTIEVSGIGNSSSYDYEGNVAVAVFDRQGNRVAEPENTAPLNLSTMTAVFNQKFEVQSELENLEDGEYMIYPVTKESRDGYFFDWMRVVDADRVFLTVEGDDITVGEPVYDIILTAIDGSATEVPQGGNIIITATLSNTSGETATGSIGFLITETETNRKKMKKSADFTAYGDGETTASADFTIGSTFEIGKSYTISIDGANFTGLPFEMTMPEDISFTFTVTDQAGVGNIDSDAVRIYPNPVADMLHIDSPEAVKSIQVYGTDGKLVKSADNTMSIDLSDCPAGYYIVIIDTDGTSIRKAVVKR